MIPKFSEKMLITIHANMVADYMGLDVDLDLRNYRSVGYRIHCDSHEMESLSGGNFNAHLTLPITHEPELDVKCRCDHPIAWNCPVRHVNDPNLVFMFGRCCIKRFFGENALKRSCRDCGKAHRNRSSMYCKSCRIKCKCCKTFHPDNSVCFKCDSCKGATKRLHGNSCSSCFKERELSQKPSFNSKYDTIREVFSDKSYIKFLLTRGWFMLRPEYDLYLTLNDLN